MGSGNILGCWVLNLDWLIQDKFPALCTIDPVLEKQNLFRGNEKSSIVVQGLLPAQCVGLFSMVGGHEMPVIEHAKFTYVL